MTCAKGTKWSQFMVSWRYHKTSCPTQYCHPQDEKCLWKSVRWWILLQQSFLRGQCRKEPFLISSQIFSESFFSHLADKFLREGKSKSGCNCGRGLFFLVMWMNIRITRYTSQFYSHNINPLVFLEPDCCLLARALECKVATFFLLHKVKMFSQIFPRQFLFQICQIYQLPPWFPHQGFSKTIVKT